MTNLMSVLASEKSSILLDFSGATRRSRTDDLLITNAKKSGPETKG
jgi:hypothetical protein